MIQHSSIIEKNPVRRKSDGQFLTPIDRTLRCFDSFARQSGYPGIETQMLVWLEGRADAASLQTAITRLSKQYPVITARLVENDPRSDNRPYWRFRPGEICSLLETALASDDPSAVLGYAGDVLSNGRDPTDADPLEFHLLHRPGGKDVLLLQYNHVLMDNRMAVPLLHEIERLTTSVPHSSKHREPTDFVFEHLQQIPRDKRRKMIQAAFQLHAHEYRGGVATLLPASASSVGRARLKIIARSLDLPQASRLRGRITALCGFPCLSMAILGSAFRAIDALGPPADKRENFAAGIGIPVTGPHQAFAFLNETSAIAIRVSRQDLHERDQLTKLLSEQLRQRLAEGIDLGVLGLIAIYSRQIRYIEWVVRHLVLYGYSLWYAYFGNLDAVGSTFCGSRIEEIIHTGGPLWPSIGLALLVNQSRGRLNFQATFDERLISLELAEALLDFILADLVAFRDASITSATK